MINATPLTPQTGTRTTVDIVAEGFFNKEIVRLGDYMVVQLEDGWKTQLTFTRVSDGRTFTKKIHSDGPTHAATEAVGWWMHDAWSL